MPARISAWAVYELFSTADGERVFVGVTSDNQWRSFCTEFDLPDLLNDISLSTNEMRVDARARLIPQLVMLFKSMTAEEIERRCLKANLPFARIARPEDLFEDPHLNANGSLADTVFPGVTAKLPKLPLRIAGQAFDLRSNPPAAGEHNAALIGAKR
jgi:crotonobetainyl-CoA:carnitine CoA-transferase CaiB-like acyl-CoA transferase